MNNKSAPVKYVQSHNHHMDWNNPKNLSKETDCTKIKFLEFLFIHSNNHDFNGKTKCFYLTACHNSKIKK